MTNSDKEEFAERTQDHLNEYIILADKKSSILLTAQLAFIGLYINIIRNGWAGANCAFKILSVITVLTGLGAIGLAGWTVYPRTPDTEEGLMLWKTIVNTGEENYIKKIQSINSDSIFNEILEENHKLAVVADKKYKYLRLSLILTGAMVLASLLAVLVLLW
jgi:hypothetical protein